MIPLIYDFLFLLMLFVLYYAGKGLQKNGGKLSSPSGIAAILVFTLNEGLRFGRGVDYGTYWDRYETIAKGFETDMDLAYVYTIKIMSYIGIPYQGFFILQSFVCILGILVLLRNYSEYFPFALPIFVFYSCLQMENLIRWYFGFSFIFLGLPYLLRNQTFKYYLISLCGFFFHYGLIPLPFVFHAIFKFKKPLLHPFFSIPLFVVIGLSFETDVMQAFADVVNLFALVSERAEGYADNAEKWLTEGFGGIYTSALPGIAVMLFWFCIIWCGYKIVMNKNDHRLTYVYNLTLLGFLVVPMGNKIEMVMRYNDSFVFFRGLIVAVVLYELFYIRSLKFTLIPLLLLALFIRDVEKRFAAPFYKPQLHMYVWDKKNETWENLKQNWLDDQYEASEIQRKKTGK